MQHGTTLALLVTMANLTGVAKRINAIRYTTAAAHHRRDVLPRPDDGDGDAVLLGG